MYFAGFDHWNNGAPHKDLQIGCHRIDHKINSNLPDGELKHLLLYGVHKDDFYTRDDINLAYILDECKANNIVPMINNNAPYLDRNISVIEYARRCRLIDLILYEYGFKKAYISIMNEPGKFYDTPQYCMFVNLSKSTVKHYPVVAGNDEYNMLDWNFLLDNANFDYLGVHPLSSLGYPPNWNMLSSWASMATARGRGVIATETGSWFKSYSSSEGWAVIKNLILKCKYLNYEAVCIVCVDINEDHPVLGFRRFDKNYNRLVHTSPYWGEFIKLVNREGKKYKEEFIIGDDDMKLVNLSEGSINGQVRHTQEILMIEYGYPNEYEDPFDGKYGKATRDQIKLYQKANGLKEDGIVGINTTLDLVFDVDEKPVENRVKSTDYWYKRLAILTAFPDSYFK